MGALGAAILAILQTIVKELIGKVWEQLKVEDRVDETEGVLNKLEVLDDADLNRDLLGDVDIVPDEHSDSLPEGDALV